MKIPKRGTSASSYGKDQKIHNELLEELDSLFPAANQQKDGQGGQKLRAATLSIGRHVALHESNSKESQEMASLSNQVSSGNMHRDLQKNESAT